MKLVATELGGSAIVLPVWFRLCRLGFNAPRFDAALQAMGLPAAPAFVQDNSFTPDTYRTSMEEDMYFLYKTTDVYARALNAPSAGTIGAGHRLAAGQPVRLAPKEAQAPCLADADVFDPPHR